MATIYLSPIEFDLRIEEAERVDLTNDDASEYDRAENDAAGEINAYIAVRYPLPLASVPDIVKGWSVNITRFRLWDKRAPDEVRRRYDDTLAQLRDLAAGKLNLPADAIAAVPAAELQVAGYSATRVFTAETLKDF